MEIVFLLKANVMVIPIVSEARMKATVQLVHVVLMNSLA